MKNFHVPIYFSQVENMAIKLPIVLCMETEAGKRFTYFTWKTCLEKDVIPVIFPNSISIVFKSMGLGVFDMMGPDIVDTINVRYAELQNYFGFICCSI